MHLIYIYIYIYIYILKEKVLDCIDCVNFITIISNPTNHHNIYTYNKESGLILIKTIIE